MATRHPLLGREEQTYPYKSFFNRFLYVTGGKGAIGKALGGTPIDLPDFDVTYYPDVLKALEGADVVVHAAANKHAPEGETHPFEVADVNIVGTQNVVNACRELGIKQLVFVSTCKAADPETVYGASKLVGERIVLNAGYTVARLYNVVESSRNVFAIWDEAAKTGEIGVAQCSRFFITLDEAVSFILSCVDREPGRYAPFALRHNMIEIARKWASTRSGVKLVEMPKRRGDRQVEPRWASHERGDSQDDGAWKVVSAHD